MDDDKYEGEKHKQKFCNLSVRTRLEEESQARRLSAKACRIAILEIQ